MADESTLRGSQLATGATPLPHRLAYRHIRRNLERLLRGHPGAAQQRVPACPDWSVRDVLVHLTQNCHAAEDNLWPRSRPAVVPAALPLPELFAEWERSGRRVESGLERTKQERAGSVLVMDAFTHEYDVARALGERFEPDHPALPAAFEVAFEGFNAAVRRRCLPPLCVRTGVADWTAGEGVPYASVAGPWIDLYRSLIGRRTAAQIRALAWSQDPAPWLPTFSWGPFRVPREPVE